MTDYSPDLRGPSRKGHSARGYRLRLRTFRPRGWLFALHSAFADPPSSPLKVGCCMFDVRLRQPKTHRRAATGCPQAPPLLSSVTTDLSASGSQTGSSFFIQRVRRASCALGAPRAVWLSARQRASCLRHGAPVPRHCIGTSTRQRSAVLLWPRAALRPPPPNALFVPSSVLRNLAESQAPGSSTPQSRAPPGLAAPAQ